MLILLMATWWNEWPGWDLGSQQGLVCSEWPLIWILQVAYINEPQKIRLEETRSSFAQPYGLFWKLLQLAFDWANENPKLKVIKANKEILLMISSLYTLRWGSISHSKCLFSLFGAKKWVLKLYACLTHTHLHSYGSRWLCGLGWIMTLCKSTCNLFPTREYNWLGEEKEGNILRALLQQASSSKTSIQAGSSWFLNKCEDGLGVRCAVIFPRSGLGLVAQAERVRVFHYEIAAADMFESAESSPFIILTIFCSYNFHGVYWWRDDRTYS